MQRSAPWARRTLLRDLGLIGSATLLATALTACGSGGGGGGGFVPPANGASSGSGSTGGGSTGGGSTGGGTTTNQAPTAVFSVSPVSGTAPLTVVFDGSASTDPNEPSANLSVRWDFDGDGLFDTAFSTTKSTSFTYNSAGQFLARMELRDSGGLTSTANASQAISVLSAQSSNQAPSAAFSVSASSGTAPLAVSFDASASSDPNEPSANLSVRWDFDGDGLFDTAFTTTKSASFTFVNAGSFTPRVQVRDSGGLTATVASNQSIVVSAPNQAPSASFTQSASSGNAPLAVSFDASASSDPNEPSANLSVRWDFDGDGLFDTSFSTTKTASHTYQSAGAFSARLEVRDSGGLTSQVTGASISVSAPPVASVVANISVDTNRDGAIDASDEAGEDSFTTTGGAVFIANLDDDDGDGTRDGSDSTADGADDLLDMAAIVIRAIPALTSQQSVTLAVSPSAAASRIRIFRESGSSAVSFLGQGSQQVTVSASLLAADIALRLEASSGRSSSWDGNLTLTLTVSASGQTVSEDVVAMRCSPVIFSDNTLDAQVVYAMDINNQNNAPNQPFFNALQANMPSGVSLFDVDENTYNGDRWVQDCMQPAYQAMPGSGGARVMPTIFKCLRGRGLGSLSSSGLLGSDTGYVTPSSGSSTSLNYGGNLEIAPPHTVNGQSFPFGRVVIGGGSAGTLGGVSNTDRMASQQVALINAQEVQGPAVEVSSEWLAVGHIDEIFQFVKDVNNGNNRPFKVAIVSPTLARAALEDMENKGFGGRAVFNGRSTETTVSAILADSSLMAYNQLAQTRIDSIRSKLKSELGLDDADFVELPVLFEDVNGFGFDMAAAYNPGIQNFIVVNGTIFAPDPEGPNESGTDVWQALTNAALQPLGYTVRFVDVFESYHELLGEAHCGSSVSRDAYSTPWWQP